MTEHCKNLIVSLLIRNPSKRLGAGPEGSEEIKKHPFFKDIDWIDVKLKKLQPPKPEINMSQYNHLSKATEVVDETLRRIFDDPPGEDDQEVYEDRNVDGWSFVQPAGTTNYAGN